MASVHQNRLATHAVHLLIQRAALIARQAGRCAHCGYSMNGSHGHRRQETLDHIRALRDGGSNAPENLQLLCRACHLLKGRLPKGGMR